MSLNPTAREYADLLVQLRIGNSEWVAKAPNRDGRFYGLWGVTWAEFELDREYLLESGNIVGVVPLVEDDHHQTWVVLAPNKGGLSEPFELFHHLARRAGALIPAVIRDRIRRGAKDEDNWLSLMWTVEPPDAESLAEIGEPRLLYSWPFRSASDVIERCRLDTNEPSLPPTVLSGSPKRSPWNAAGDNPPAEYAAGPLSGKKDELCRWILPNASDDRTLDRRLADGAFWGRIEGRGKRSVWFRTQERYAEANRRRLEDLHHRS